jgi:hypothetical protein
MRRRQRYMVSALFALGYVVTAAGAARVYYTYKVFSEGDSSWWQYPTFITSTIENNLAIVSPISTYTTQVVPANTIKICACAPTIRPLFPHWFGGPISRFRSWIPSNNLSEGPSRNTLERKQISNLSQLGTRIRSFGASRSTGSNEDNDDIKLVIQKNNDHGDSSADRSNSESGFDFGFPEQHKAKDNVNVDMRAMKSTSSVTVESCTTNINPFDPRLDVKNQYFHTR